MAKLIKDIDESGFDWTPLAGKLHAVTETAGAGAARSEGGGSI